MKAPKSFTLSPVKGGKAPLRELVSWRVSKDKRNVYLTLFKFNKQFVIAIPKVEAGGLVAKLSEAATEVEAATQDGGFAG